MRLHTKGEKRFNHPVVGELELSSNRIEVAAEPGLMIVTYTAEPLMRIDTPIGSFDTFPIGETYPDGTSARLYFAPVAGGYARTEARNQTAVLGTTDLVAYRYQALEPPRFLGLTLDQWAIAVAIRIHGLPPALRIL